tara:strand:- start:4664 stop:5776 length:1113 start_codon:yes stop_codon:yes gene_type:complete
LISKFLLPPGFKDSLSFDTFVEHQYKNLIINSFRENGFSLIKTPLIEYSSNLDDNTLSLNTKKEEPKLSIRNDITPQIIRVVTSRLSKKIRPLKLCYYGEVVRKKGTILRPERQFQQVGAEIIGAESYKADVEIINLAYQTLKNIGVKNIVIEISAPFFLENILKVIKDTRLKNKLKKYIELKDINNCLKLIIDEKVKNSLSNLYSASGILKNNKLKTLKLTNNISEKEINRLYKITNLIKVSKNDRINVDLFEIQKNKKYYKGIKFTFFARGIRGEIAGGGRYNLKYAKKIEEAIGYTCYMDTVLRASSFKNKNKRILIQFNTNPNIEKSLIEKGYTLFKTFDDKLDIRKQAKKLRIMYYLSNKVVKKI